MAVNEGKTKDMLSTTIDMRRIDSLATTANNTSDTVKEFIYLDAAVTINHQSGHQAQNHTCQQELVSSQ